MAIIGANFGVVNLTPAVGFGSSIASSTIWSSDSFMTSKLSAGMGTNVYVMVSVSTRSSITFAFTYNFHIVSSIKRTNSPISGSVIITALGAFFSMNSVSVLARISVQNQGSTSCETSPWFADSSVRCKVPASGTRSNSFRLSISSTAAMISTSVTYDAIVVFNSVPLVPSSGSIFLTSSGSNFRYHDNSLWLRVGRTSCENSLWVSDSVTLCKSTSGPSTSGFVVASLAVQSSSSLHHMSFCNPGVSLIHSVAVPVSGTAIVSLFGSFVGKSDVTLRAKLGDSVASFSNWLSDSSVFVKADLGVGKLQSVWISTSRLLGFVSQVLSFGPPIPSSTLLATAPVTGGSSMSVIGTGFGVFFCVF